ncbi:MAG: leucine-rich repeat domain-containing protein, partial [bacterium]|nr:leucine-rich repeat domain-containing protein [bacterium]
ALIAVPIIIDIIEDSKKEALKRSAENYLKAVELSIAKENLNSEFNPNSCTIESGITKCGDKTLNVTVDGEIPESGEITLLNGTILRDETTKLTYKSGTLAYDSNGKLTIESPKKELIAEGTIISETTSGVAVNVDNKLVYYVPEGSNEAVVSGYRGERDYNDSIINLLWTTPQTSGDIEIASKVKINGVIYPVTKIGNSGFTSASTGADITSVIIPDSVTSIDVDAFWYCTNLKSVTIPSSVTSIGAEAFLGTPWQTKKAQENNGIVIINNILIDGTTAKGDIIIPDNVTSIAGDAFVSGMTGANITSVSIPSSVTSIGSRAFEYCSNLTSVTINGDASRFCSNWTAIGFSTSLESYNTYCN